MSILLPTGDFSQSLNQLDLPSSITIASNSVTIGAWIKGPLPFPTETGANQDQWVMELMNAADTESAAISIEKVVSAANRWVSSGWMQSADVFSQRASTYQQTGNWFLTTYTYLSSINTGYIKIYDVIGNKVQELSHSASGLDPTVLTDLKFFNSSSFYFEDVLVAGMFVYDGILADATAILSNKDKDLFISTTGANLKGFWSAYDSFTTTVLDESGNGNHLDVSVKTIQPMTYSDDNPTSPLKVNTITAKGRGHEFNCTLSIDATVYIVRQASGTAAPTDQEVIDGNGANVLEQQTQAFLTDETHNLTFSGGTTFTAYDYYIVTDDGAGFTVPEAANPYQLTTSGMISTHQLADVNGDIRPNETGIKFAWFDETDADTLTSPTDQGSFDTDGSGGFIVDLTNSGLAQAQSGRLDVDAGVWTASYFLTVE